MQPMIEVQNLGKRYQLGGQDKYYKTLRESLVRGLTRPFQRLTGTAPEAEAFWALRHASFTINEGEVVGIIGRNGAGKSTLLKLLSRITRPTEGYAKLYGRVGSLLEVGTGFHPELTGRENIFLSGSLLGMKRAEVKAKFDEIVDFSGVEKFLDTPVKHYSSGMYVRLGFAIAAHLEPEILLVDEVLAVGDAQFQKKCLGKMDEVAKTGRTVIFVSHNMAAIRGLCANCILFDKGRNHPVQPAEKVISEYLESTKPIAHSRSWLPEEAPGSLDIKLLSIQCVDAAGQPKGIFSMDEPVFVSFRYQIYRKLPPMRIVIKIALDDATPVFLTRDNAVSPWSTCFREAGIYEGSIEIPGNLLNARSYTVSFSAEKPPEPYYFLLEDLVAFMISDNRQRGAQINEPWPGIICPPVCWITWKANSNA